MGQRFQFYVRTKGDMKQNSEPIIIGYHNQWCWGCYSLIRAEQLMKYISNDMKDNFSCFKRDYIVYEKYEIVKSLIQINQENLSFTGVCQLSEVECENPSYADNNDGALFIDTTGEKPKYCFFDPYDKSPSPLNASEYASKYMLDLNDDDVKKLKIYEKYLKKLSKYELCTKQDLEIAFPKMYEVENEEDGE